MLRLTEVLRLIENVLRLIKNDIAKDGSTSRNGISPKEKFMVTLRYLAGGKSYKTLCLFVLGLSGQVLKAINVVDPSTTNYNYSINYDRSDHINKVKNVLSTIFLKLK